MPVDQYEDDDDAKDGNGERGGRAFKDYDCPDCSANNPVDEPLHDGDEVCCHYCGTEWQARITDDGRLKLREA